jgi:hypothetical protein
MPGQGGKGGPQPFPRPRPMQQTAPFAPQQQGGSQPMPYADPQQGGPPPPAPTGRGQESGLPGGIYTASQPDQPPPWYHPNSPDTEGLPGGVASKPVPPAQKGMGATPGQTNRPHFYKGDLTIGGQSFRFGSGGGHYPSLPFGTYYLNPQGIGSVGHRIGAITGISDTPGSGNTVNDPMLKRGREGVEIHPSTNSRLSTNGCIGVDRNQWGQFRQAFNQARANGQQLTLTVRPDGSASIQPASTMDRIRSIRPPSQLEMAP